MIIELIVILIIIVAAVIPAMQLYELLESDFLQSLVLVAYGVFSTGMVIYWLVKYIIVQLNM
jgi:hypothetical protein